MEKTKKLAQIAEAAKLLESLVKEYNEDIDTYEAYIADIYIKTEKDLTDTKCEIHLHGTTENLWIDFELTNATDYEGYTVKDYGARFHGVDLTDCQFEWHEIEKEAGDNAKMAV